MSAPKLNEAQAAAVEHDQGPMLVLAGAGSGKTRVITHRIARLLERGTRPNAILAVSFTNKAAAEMVERMVPLVGKSAASKLWLSTFHSFGVKFLREENRAYGYDGRFVIFDQGDCLGLVREILKRELPSDRKLDTMALLTRISLWKNAFLAPEEVPPSEAEYDAIALEIYPHYEKALRNMHAVDFDDLVVAPVRILRMREDIRAKWQRRFRYLLIDEFQDTNKSQLELVKLLANELGNVCVVGDDDQSIYGWRGAEVGNILDFEKTFPGTKVVKLELNYRSKSPILDVANAVIGRSTAKRHRKRLVATQGEGPPVQLATAPDAPAEAKMVSREIRRLVKERIRYKDIAVLYRSNLQARLIEEELRVEGIPYRLYGGTQFFDRKEVKDCIAYLRTIVHPEDDLSFRRIVNTPTRGIGDTTVERLSAYATLNRITFAQAIDRAHEIDKIPDAAKRSAMHLSAALRKARNAFHHATQGRGTLSEATEQLFRDVGIEASYATDDSPEGKRRGDNVAFLMKSIRRYEQHQSSELSVSQFLTRLTLRFDTEDEDAGNRVTLSSLHSAKGLEFPYVFLIGCVEGILPHSRTMDPKVTEAAPTDVEEERRLFYVGVTRAREKLYLTRPERRTSRGRIHPLTPTRFLDGIPADAIEQFHDPGEEAMGHDEIADAAAAILAQLRGS